LLDKDYSESQIIGLADVDELGLDLETVKDILSYERINRGAAKVMGKKVFDFGKYLCKEILEGCFTAPSYYLKHAKDNNPPTGLFGTFAYLGSAAGSGYEYFSDSNTVYASLIFITATTTNIINGIYEWHKSEKKKLREQRLSQLEQIINGEED
jgi:hypothetical protein